MRVVATRREEATRSAKELMKRQALEVSQQVETIRTTKEHSLLLENEIKALQESLQAQRTEINILTTELHDLQLQSTSNGNTATLESELSRLQESLSAMEKEHQAVVNDLQSRLSEGERVLGKDMESEVVQLKMSHIEELGAIQSRLVDTSSSLEELEARYAALDANYQGAIAEAGRVKIHLEDAQRALSEAAITHAADRQMREEQVVALQEQLVVTEKDLESATESLEEMKSLHMETLAAEREEHDEELRSLRSSMADLQAILDEELRRSEETLRAVRDELDLEVQRRIQSEEAITEVEGRSNSVLEEVRLQLSAITAELEEVQAKYSMLQEERTTLQQNSTVRDAEYQRSLSLNRFLERQIGDK
jgi:chromosome segregation ATPase